MESAFHVGAEHTVPAGLIPATVTPMTRAGQVDWAGLRRYLEWIGTQGPAALAVTADTAEVAHLSHAEQLRMVETAKESTTVPCIAGLTASGPAQAVERARDLRRAGAEALLVFPNPAFRGAPDQEVLDYHAAIGEAGLPLIAFQLQPALGGVRYPPSLLRRLLTLDAVVALKEASFERVQFRQAAALVAEAGPARLLTGNDNFILESFVLGADGALLGFGALLTADQVALIEAWREGRTADAEAASARLQPLADAVFAAPVGDYRARIKECLVWLGVLESAHVRGPRPAIGDAERARLHRMLRERAPV